MDYHSDRFVDHSLLFHDEGRLVAVLPANQQGEVLVTHGGLTFGGLVCGTDMKSPRMLEVFDALLGYMRGRGLKTLRYKAIPHIYHRCPAEEDLYALFRNGARLVRRDVSAALHPGTCREVSVRRRRGRKRAESLGIRVSRSNDLKSFHRLVSGVLEARHGVRPVHTLEELELLSSRFPENIKMYGAFAEDTLVAGVLVYENMTVAHAQYIASGLEGRKAGALDLLFEFLIEREFSGKRWFDFGISTEHEGRTLNVGLATFKEEFGARAVVYDTYELSVPESP
jgi:hypothetical protein